MQYSTSDIIKVWRAQQTGAAQIIQRYYSGKNVPLELLDRRIDGKDKTITITNWTKIFADSHVSFMTSKDIKYFITDDQVSPDGLMEFKRFYEYNDIEALDAENVLNAILYGYAVNIHSFNGQEIETTGTVPYQWAFLKDANANVVAGVYRVKLPAHTVYGTEILAEDKTLYFVYTDTEVTTLEVGRDGNISGGKVEPHSFGRLPITIFKVTKDMTPFFGTAFFSACDNYDVVASSMTDSIKYDIDALLLTKGLKVDDLLTKDANGKSNIAKIREAGLFPVPKDADAEYITKSVDTEKYKASLSNTRDMLHMQACVPDLQKLVLSGTTSVSGIALKMLYNAQIQKCGEFAKYFMCGLRDRVDFFNVVSAALGKPTLINYQIEFDFNLPSNPTEILQYLPNLEGILSTKDKIRILELVDSPDTAYANLLAEQEAAKTNTTPTVTAPTMMEQPDAPMNGEQMMEDEN